MVISLLFIFRLLGSAAVYGQADPVCRHCRLNGLLVICQIDNASPGGGCTKREISPWLSQEMRTWTHSHQTFQQKRSENQLASLLAEGI